MDPKPLSARACSLLILLFGIAAYSNTLSSAFQFDDVVSILANQALYPLNPGRIWHDSPSRFLTHLSFAFNIYLAGFETWSFHLLNLLIHVLTSIIAFKFTRSILETPALKDRIPSSKRELFALIVALVFAMHPVQTQAVTYITQRLTSLATLFYLATLRVYLKARLENVRHYISVCLLMLAAMLTKEISISLPFAILLTELCFFPPSDLRSLGKKLLRWSPFAAFLAIIPALFLMNTHMFERIGGAMRILPTWTRDISRWDYLLTQFRVIRTYLRLLFFPVDQCLDYDYPLSSGWGNLDTWASFSLLLSVLLLALILFKKNRLLAFGILWFFLTLSVESSIIPLHDVIFEHRLYLPTFGFALVLTSLLWTLTRSVKIFIAVSLPIILIFSGMTYARNEVWKDPFTLWQDVIKRSPRKWRGYCSLGLAYAREKNDLPTALLYFNKALQTGSYSSTLLDNMATAYFQLGNTQAGAYYQGQASSLANTEPRFAQSITSIVSSGNADLATGEEAAAVASFRKAIEMAPLSKSGYSALALYYVQRGNPQKATAVMMEYLKKKKNHKPLFGNFVEIEGL